MDKETFIKEREADLIDDHACNDNAVIDMALMIAKLEWEVSFLEQLLDEVEQSAEYWEDLYRSIT